MTDFMRSLIARVFAIYRSSDYYSERSAEEVLSAASIFLAGMSVAYAGTVLIILAALSSAGEKDILAFVPNSRWVHLGFLLTIGIATEWFVKVIVRRSGGIKSLNLKVMSLRSHEPYSTIASILVFACPVLLGLSAAMYIALTS